MLDGIDVKSGLAFEIGYAAALGKPIIGLKTDYRNFSKIENVNLILEISMKGIYGSTKEVIKALKSVHPKEATKFVISAKTSPKYSRNRVTMPKFI